MSYCVTLYGSELMVKCNYIAKPAGLSQHSDTLKTWNKEEDEEESWRRKGEMWKADGDEKHGKRVEFFLGVRRVYEPKQFFDRFITVVLS